MQPSLAAAHRSGAVVPASAPRSRTCASSTMGRPPNLASALRPASLSPAISCCTRDICWLVA